MLPSSTKRQSENLGLRNGIFCLFLSSHVNYDNEIPENGGHASITCPLAWQHLSSVLGGFTGWGSKGLVTHGSNAS